MGRATDPGENHDPGNDQRFTPSLTQEPRLENGLGGEPSFVDDRAGDKDAPVPAIRPSAIERPDAGLDPHSGRRHPPSRN